MPKLAPFPPINAKAFAQLCGVSVGLVSTWCDEGMPCIREARQGSEVSVDLRRALPWLLKQRALKPDAARLSVAREQAKRLQMQNDKARGKLIDTALMEEGFKAAIAALLQDWDALAQRCTPDVEIQTTIERECRAAQQRFSDALAAHADALTGRADALE